MKKTFFALMALVFALMGTSCGMVSDPETEKKIAGSWTTTKTEKEDGLRYVITEYVTYTLGEGSTDNTFKIKIVMRILEPYDLMGAELATVSCSGTWTASKEKLIGEIDKNSVNISVGYQIREYLSSSDIKAMENEFVNELENGDLLDGGEILSISENELRIRDQEDGEVYEYTRKN